jgi:MFS family permease
LDEGDEEAAAMTTAVETLPRPAGFARWPLYYGWVNLAVAALAMVGTLPGRTQGLGLVTEPLLADLGLGRVAYAQINLAATLVGALFCFGIGRLVDRMGSRLVLTALAASLGVVVIAMSAVAGVVSLLLLLTLTRGLGQSALSVVSLTMVGKWFARRLSAAMGVYSVVMTVGFMLAFPAVQAAAEVYGWRRAWAGVGVFLLLGLAPISWLLVRRTPEAVGLPIDGEDAPAGGSAAEEETSGETLGTALRGGAFWVFALAAAVYGLAASGIGLFNESILKELGFGTHLYRNTLAVTAIVGLLGNFAGGWFAQRGSLRVLLVAAMFLLACGLAGLPLVTAEWHAYADAVVMGVAGGFVMVVFFAFWGKAYGRAHLGRIQGAAQILTVLASAVGPLLLAQCVEWTGAYASAFYGLALVVAALGGAGLVVTLPARLTRPA